MRVYKLKLIGDSNTYWLTEKNAEEIIRKWESGGNLVITVPKYGLRVRSSKISEIHRSDETEPYPKEFKEQLLAESGVTVTQLNSGSEDIKNLPTDLVILDENLNIVQAKDGIGAEARLKKKWSEDSDSVPCFYYATAHFRTGNSENEYLLVKSQIKKLVKAKFDSEYPSSPIILGEWKYGVPNNALNGKTGEEQVQYT